MTFQFDEYSYGEPHVIVYTRKDAVIYIGKFCSIANVTFHIDGNHNIRSFSSFPFNERLKWQECPLNNWGKTTPHIGNDVWIGHGVTVFSGVVIGDGAVVAGNSVVTKSVPPYAVVAGNPAKVVKFRFTSEQIHDLLELKWWNLSLNLIRERLIPHMEDIVKIIETLKELKQFYKKKYVVYGARGRYKDITTMVSEKCCTNGKIIIPASDVKRAGIFGDPLPNVFKHIIFVDIENNKKEIYSSEMEISIMLKDFELK